MSGGHICAVEREYHCSSVLAWPVEVWLTCNVVACGAWCVALSGSHAPLVPHCSVVHIDVHLKWSFGLKRVVIPTAPILLSHFTADGLVFFVHPFIKCVGIPVGTHLRQSPATAVAVALANLHIFAVGAILACVGALACAVTDALTAFIVVFCLDNKHLVGRECASFAFRQHENLTPVLNA